MAFLTLINGPHAGRLHRLNDPRSILGRHPDCDVVVEQGAVSRHHAQVERAGESFYVEDLNSRNGTYVNDVLIDERRHLNEGDRIRVCDLSFTFHLTEKPPGPSLRPSGAGGSSVAVVMDDDDADSTGSSTIMSRLDVSLQDSSTALSTSTDAKLSALLEITQSLGKALALDEVLPQVLNSLFKIFLQADRGFIALLGEDGALVPRWTKVRREGNDDEIRISRTVVNQVMDTKEAILSADAVSDTRFEMSQSIADFRIRSMICAPLIDAEGACFGVLQIDTHDQRHRFRKEDLDVLASVASSASIAINNAQLHENALSRRALDRDLQLAHQVQHGFLPKRAPELPGYMFYDFYRPADQIGGDYFDYIHLPNGRMAIVVADVVGHGIAAALLMAQLSAAVRSCLIAEADPAAAVTHLNRMLADDRVEDRFITLVLSVLHPDTNELTIVSAGHMAPLVRRKSGELEEVGADVGGFPLGVVDDASYQAFSTQLAPGDVLVMYTDGLNEAMDSQGDQYGIDRIRGQLANGADVRETGANLIDDIRQFVGEGPQIDDMCLVCCGRG